MTLNVGYDIKKLFDKLETKFGKLENKVDKIGENVSQLKTDVKVLNQKVEGIDKPLDTQDFINRGVAIGLLVALIGGLAKLFGFDGIHRCKNP